MTTFILISYVFLAGFGCGYGVREIVSRRRRAAARAEYYKEHGLDLPKNVSAFEALRLFVNALGFKPSRKPK